MVGWMLGAALAAEPRAVIDDDGNVVGSVVVAVPVAEALAVVSDPVRVASIHEGGTRVTLTGADGDCLLADYESDSAWSTIAYSVRQCPIGGGVETRLVASSAFETYWTRWRVDPVEGGARLVYTLHSVTSMPVPQFVVNRVSRASVQRLMERLDAFFAEPR